MIAFQSVTQALFKARMWCEYAQAWDGRPTSTGVGSEWNEFPTVEAAS